MRINANQQNRLRVCEFANASSTVRGGLVPKFLVPVQFGPKTFGSGLVQFQKFWFWFGSVPTKDEVNLRSFADLNKKLKIIIS